MLIAQLAGDFDAFGERERAVWSRWLAHKERKFHGEKIQDFLFVRNRHTWKHCTEHFFNINVKWLFLKK